MLGKASESLANRLVKSNIIQEEELELYRFGIENFLMRVCHIISYLLIGVLFHLLPELILFLIAFITLRESSGGYHAKTPFKCYIISCITVITAMCLIRFVPESLKEYSIALGLIVSIVLFFIVPVETENKPLDDSEIMYYKSKAGLIIIVELGLVLVFRMLYLNYLSFILALSLTYELVVALAGLYIKAGTNVKAENNKF